MSRGLINRLTRERDQARARVAELEAKIRKVELIASRAFAELTLRQQQREYNHMSEMQPTASGPEQL